MVIDTPAVVLKSFSYGETSMIAHCFSKKNGKINLIIKGAKSKKSPKSPYFQPLSYIDIIYNHKLNRDLQTVSKVNFRGHWLNIIEDLYRISLAMTVLEITNKVLSENDPHPVFFKTLLRVLELLNNKLINPKIAFWFYECALLSNLGFQPTLENPDLPGLVLPDIQNDPSSNIILATLLSGNIDNLYEEKISKKTNSLISNYLWSLITYHFENLSNIKSISVVRKLLS
tara:strand:- start:276 stop:962 length:687 start_codon:yes stop_codon:yes gene_type:complete